MTAARKGTGTGLQSGNLRFNWQRSDLPRSSCRFCYDGGVQTLHRITADPAVMGGRPCIRGMRVTVGMVVEAIAAGRSVQDLLADFPYLEEEDVREAGAVSG